MFFEVASLPSFPKIPSSLMRHVCAYVLQVWDLKEVILGKGKASARDHHLPLPPLTLRSPEI